ncbi:MAG: sugar phosphate isomerase/epimerase family protein [Acetobacteraceae bacterium]|nr:sugar phosphate isomerase/epimerase family protein [Acetobacteraceae bacterium]
MHFATRLNSFASRPELFWPEEGGKPDTVALMTRAATAEGLDAVDLNYPDHFATHSSRALTRRAADLGLRLNGLAMRYYGEPAFRAGAFTNPDAAVRRRAIDLTKRGIDAAAETGADLMTLWLGQDGFDHAFAAEYGTLWDLEIAGLREVANHNPAVAVSIEYKPDEPRAHALLADIGTTLLAIREAGSPNLGVTLDFAHVLYAGEQPAASAALVARHSRLLGLHLNDGYGKRDDGLMVGAIHTVQTLELLRQARRDGYAGVIYFDTFPDTSGLDPVAECEANIATVRAMLNLIDRLEADNRLADALARQDAVAGQRIVQAALLGATPLGATPLGAGPC